MYGSIDDTSLLGEQETEIDFGGQSQITASSVIEKTQASLVSQAVTSTDRLPV